MTKSRGGGVLEVLGRCSPRVMTPGYAEVTFTIDFEIFPFRKYRRLCM